MKVIFHVVEADKWDDVISNVKDLLNNIDDIKIEIIVMSKAASLFNRYSGVDFEGVMGNPKVNITIGKKALEENRLTKELIPSSIKVEDLVITKIVQLQNEGYAYIRL
ncbi:MULTISPECIES: hypothetical protein [Peptoniphilus]|jgi:hypothetical protein|uniref:DsrE family protein n=1 Tax=Peptoniphilus TaxID=162289 RepID=UPI00028845BB|nr:MULTISPECIES: hypothetical protein [Peptoniphilus]MBS6611175.1 hypothetical protein [Peptoniphilus harei]MDU1044190.1 hypothetical protein [Peptoniphilus rhinitidis]MDU1955182.1 hypothetical protein [Peptoniphilus lacydonensis]MDU2109452.1 hypothetical protein [Peptoniphilus lacydonensis]MDU2115983.1 hypothetical protein [Peptoniphilus lacydonensis]